MTLNCNLVSQNTANEEQRINAIAALMFVEEPKGVMNLSVSGNGNDEVGGILRRIDLFTSDETMKIAAGTFPIQDIVSALRIGMDGVVLRVNYQGKHKVLSPPTLLHISRTGATLYEFPPAAASTNVAILPISKFGAETLEVPRIGICSRRTAKPIKEAGGAIRYEFVAEQQEKKKADEKVMRLSFTYLPALSSNAVQRGVFINETAGIADLLQGSIAP